MAVAYENGVNLFDTAEVYASGRCGFVLKSEMLLMFPLSQIQCFPASESTAFSFCSRASLCFLCDLYSASAHQTKRGVSSQSGNHTGEHYQEESMEVITPFSIPRLSRDARLKLSYYSLRS